MKTLWLVRHARPLIAPGHCYGRLDMAADAQATQHAAQQLAKALRQRLPNGASSVHLRHSPLQRCEQLVLDLKGLEPDLMAISDPRLQEMDFGAWEGQSWEAIGEAAIHAWAQQLGTHAPGGGESLAQMLQRVDAALQQACQRPEPHQVWITHAGVARCVQWLLQQGTRNGTGNGKGKDKGQDLRLPSSQQWRLNAPAYGQWLLIPLATTP